MTDPMGRIVISTAGRDKGRSFAIIGVCDEAHVYIADGRTHKLDHPKKKKLKHLRFISGSVDLDAMPSLKSGAADAYVRKELMAYCHDSQETIKEG